MSKLTPERLTKTVLALLDEIKRLRQELDILGLAIEEARNADPSLEGIPSFGEAVALIEGGGDDE